MCRDCGKLALRVREQYVERTYRALAADWVNSAKTRVRTMSGEAWLTPAKGEGIAAECKRLGILDAYLVGDKRLGDCRREDLQDAARVHRAKAAGYEREATFLDSLASRLSGNKTVRKAWKAEEVIELRK